MKYFTSLFLASLVTIAIAQDSDNVDNIGNKQGKKDHSKNLTSDQRTCRRMWNVNRAQQIANNSTRIEMIAKKNPARAARIRDIATKDGPELARLQQNSTLTGYCNVYQTSERQRRQCYNVKNMDKLQKKINDKSAVDEMAKKENVSPDDVRRKWQHDLDQAQKSKDNKTFVDTCAKLKETKQGKGSAETGKQKSSASVVGSSLFAVVLAGLFAGLTI